jgi:hypothetical protein
MTLAAVIPLRIFAARKYCPGYDGEGCMTQIPGDRERCMYHAKPPAQRVNAPLWERRLEHVRNHLRAQDRPFLPYLIEPVSIAKAAENMGPGYTSRMVDHAFDNIRASLGLVGSSNPALARITLLRVIAGMDPCPICLTL